MNLQNTGNLSKPYFENLNGLRAFGALSVFCFHTILLGYQIWGNFFEHPYFTIFAKIISKGSYGVSLFFVLSGFLITYLLMHEAATKGKINIRSFFMRRLLRIWPLYFIVTGFGFLILPHLLGGIETTNSGWMYSFFLSNFEEIRNGFKDPVNLLTVTWSVSVEEQFYMGWVFLMALFPFLRRGKHFLPFLMVLVLTSVVFRFTHLNNENVLYYHTLSVISDMAIGGLLAYCCFHYRWNKKFQSIPVWVNLIMYFLTLALILGSRSIFPMNSWGLAIEKLVIGIFLAYIIFDQAFGKFSLFKADRIPFFYKMGEISYGIYMYHCIVIYFVQLYFVDMGWTQNLGQFIFYFLLTFAITIGVSWLSYHFIERRLLRLKKYFS